MLSFGNKKASLKATNGSRPKSATEVLDTVEDRKCRKSLESAMSSMELRAWTVCRSKNWLLSPVLLTCNAWRPTMPMRSKFPAVGKAAGSGAIDEHHIERLEEDERGRESRGRRSHARHSGTFRTAVTSGAGWAVAG